MISLLDMERCALLATFVGTTVEIPAATLGAGSSIRLG
jgi:hypothetical protein